MSDCIKKEVMDSIVCDINVLDLNLKHWLNCDTNIKFDMSKKIEYKQDFINFALEDTSILNNVEIDDLTKLDKQVSTQILSLNFEKNILLKRKNLAISSLDIFSVVELSKSIDELESRIIEVKTNLHNQLNNYTNIINDRICLYNKFVNDVNNVKTIKQLYNKKEYDSMIVGYYRFNKICDFILSSYKTTAFDLNLFFDDLHIKNLLKYDYLRVKQKVGAYVGANS